jgi:glycolate oxidase FAD binding subunit
MMTTMRPDTPEQVCDAIRWAAAERQPLEVAAASSKAAFGRPMTGTQRLDVSAFTGIVLYEPEELVITARAATPLAEIEAVVADKNQQLAFEPGDWSALLRDPLAPGTNVGGTLGGVIACNLSGPRRIKVGAARDHLLGFSAVSGRGEAFKSGGRVVKNVTGFDLSKLIAGSFGTLAVITEVTLRALPRPDDTRTVVLFGATRDLALKALTTALKSQADVSGAAHLPADVAALSQVAGVARAGGPVTALRLEGPGPSVDYRSRTLRSLLAPHGETGELFAGDSQTLWQEIRDVRYFVDTADRQIWRLSVAPTEGARVAAAILSVLDGQVYFDWGGGLLWLSLSTSAEAGEKTVRGAVAGGGHATLIRADADVRARVPVFQPQPGPLAGLTRRIKDGFDPHHVLNPQRMYSGL